MWFWEKREHVKTIKNRIAKPCLFIEHPDRLMMVGEMAAECEKSNYISGYEGNNIRRADSIIMDPRQSVKLRTTLRVFGVQIAFGIFS